MDSDVRAVERPRRKAPWVIAAAVALVGAGIAVTIAGPFTSTPAGSSEVAENTGATGVYTVARQDLSSQTEVSAVLGYAGSYSISAPTGASAQQVAQDRQTVTEDKQTVSADQQAEADKGATDDQAVAAAQTNVALAHAGLTSDQASQSRACAGSAASSSACIQAEQKISQDNAQVTEAGQELASTQLTATVDRDQNQIRVALDQTKLAGDQASLASLQAAAVNPGTIYTWLPAVGDVVKEDQPLYSLANEPVPLLYGTVPAYRAFYIGMSDGADVGELTRDLIALGDGAGVTEINHYSAATAAAVERWQRSLGLRVNGAILLGQVVFEPGPIRVTSVAPSVGESVGGGTVLSATSTTRQVSIALNAGQQSEVAVGDKVTITLPNSQTTPGVISLVGTVATAPSSTGGSSSGGSSPTITVLVDPTDPAVTGTWDQAPVNVTITTGTATNALAVPVDALLAQPDGGYTVEVVNADGTRHLLPVSLGLFDDAQGLVQVKGTSLTASQRIVVPKL